MKFSNLNPRTKKALIIFLCYIAAAIAIVVGNKTSPAGPCTPGMGDFIFLFLLPMSFVLFLVQIGLFIIDIVRKSSYFNLAAMFLHLAAFVIVLAVLFENI